MSLTKQQTGLLALMLTLSICVAGVVLSDDVDVADGMGESSEYRILYKAEYRNGTNSLEISSEIEVPVVLKSFDDANLSIDEGLQFIGWSIGIQDLLLQADYRLELSDDGTMVDIFDADGDEVESILVSDLIDEGGIISGTPATIVFKAVTANIETCIVTFVYGAGVTENTEITWGDKLVTPEDPVKEGFTFDGWMLNGELQSDEDLYDFVVKADVAFYAAFTAVEPVVDEPEPAPSAPAFWETALGQCAIICAVFLAGLIIWVVVNRR